MIIMMTVSLRCNVKMRKKSNKTCVSNRIPLLVMNGTHISYYVIMKQMVNNCMSLFLLTISFFFILKGIDVTDYYYLTTIQSHIC